MRTRISLIITAVAVAAALTACGDSGPSKSAFTTKADGSCAAGNTAISGVAKPSNAPQVATSAGTAVTTIDSQVAALRAMKTPGGKDKTQIESIVGNIAAVSAPTKALQDAAGKNDEPAMAKAATDMQAKVDAASTSAAAYGLTQCGTGLKPAVANLFEGTKSVLKSTYLTKTQALCRDALTKSHAITAPTSSSTSTARYLEAQLAISTKLAADLKAVPTPPGDQDAVGKISAAFDSFNAKLKEMSAAAKANNPKLFSGLSEEADVATTALNAGFDAYGVKTCGSAGI